MVLGSRFYDNDVTILVHKVAQLPEAPAEAAVSDASMPENVDDLPDLDGTGGYIVQASIDILDGNSAELKEKGSRQLLAIKEALKQAIELVPGDRLALDTRIPVNMRRN
jgi:hypothetical protein